MENKKQKLFFKYVKRFFKAFFPRLTPGDIEYLRSVLNKQEQILFYRMKSMDQKHSLNTAYTLAEFIQHSPRINQKNMAKVALLHDVGKITWSPSLLMRVWSVIIDSIIPPLGTFLAKKGKNPKAWKLAKALYIKKEHGVLGAEILKEHNWHKDLLFLIANYHAQEKSKDPLELKLLRKADEEN